MFILYAFDMAREMQITPRRINYVKEKENELFETLNDIATKKQDEIKSIIMESLLEMRESLLEKATNYEFKGKRILGVGELEVRVMLKFVWKWLSMSF